MLSNGAYRNIIKWKCPIDSLKGKAKGAHCLRVVVDEVGGCTIAY